LAEKKSHRVASILATILWVVGFALAFIIPKTSIWLWLSDGLLLFGFWPLLWTYRARWLWLAFGLLNMGIGFILLVSQYISDEYFAGHADLLKMKAHLAEYHFPWAWILIGFVSSLIGLVRIAIALVAWMKARGKKTTTDVQPAPPN
jgi:hypothetical protein